MSPTCSHILNSYFGFFKVGSASEMLAGYIYRQQLSIEINNDEKKLILLIYIYLLLIIYYIQKMQRLFFSDSFIMYVRLSGF